MKRIGGLLSRFSTRRRLRKREYDIVFMLSKLSTGVGGSERSCIEIVQGLRDRGYDVSIAHCDHRHLPATIEIPDDIPVVNMAERAGIVSLQMDRSQAALTGIPLTMTNWIAARQRVIHSLREFVTSTRPRVVVPFTSAFVVTAVGAMEGLGYRPRVVAGLRNSFEWEFGERADGPNLSHKWLLAPALGRCRAIQMLFPSYVRKLGALANHGPRLAGRTAWIPNAIRPNPHGAADLSSRKIISVGRLEPVKGQANLIRAFRKVHDAHPGWTLDIYGEGSLRGELEALVSSEGLEESVKLPGYHTHFSRQWLDASINVQPSTDEGFSRALTEAMGAGLPSVVFADCPGNNELVADGANGLLADPSDRVGELAAAILRLVENEELRRTLGTAARATAEKGVYSADSAFDRWARLMDAVLTPGPIDLGGLKN